MKTLKPASFICVTFLAFSILCGLAGCGGDSSDENIQMENSFNQSSNVTMTIAENNSSSVKLAYALLPGQYPSMLGARIVAWTGLAINGSNVAADVALSENATTGYVTITGLTPDTTDYVFGLVASTNTAAPLAILTLPHGQAFGSPSQNQLNVPYLESSSVVVDYSVVAGILPKTQGLSISLWEGDSATIYTRQPLANIPLTSDAPTGTVTLYSTFATGKTYTVALLVGSGSSDIAAATTLNP